MKTNLSCSIRWAEYRDNEQRWLTNVVNIIRDRDKDALGVYDSRLKDVEGGFSVTFNDEGFSVYANDGLGNPADAISFISAYLRYWQPHTAVRMDIQRKDENGRNKVETVLIGPEGVHKVKGLSWRRSEKPPPSQA